MTFDYNDSATHWCDCGHEHRYTPSEVMDGEQAKCARCGQGFVYLVRDGEVWTEEAQ